MKKLLYILLSLPLIVLGQVDDIELIEGLTINIDIQEGWNNIGYTCHYEKDATVAFFSIEDKIILAKDVVGNAYLPEWNFNGIGNLIPGYGYQLKTSDAINQFSFNSSCLIGCLSSWADNFDVHALFDDESCYRYGCIDPLADNYNVLVTIDDGSCIFPIGCTEQWADNYDELAIIDSGSCYKDGCTSANAINYDSYATIDDGNCYFDGCTDPNAWNYEPLASIDNGLCTYGTPIECQLTYGWNMVGFTACEITPIEEAVNNALSNGAGISNTFQIIKDIRGKFWHSSLGDYSALTQLTPGEGYMMYVNGEPTTIQFSEQYCNDITYQLNSGWNLVAFTGSIEADNNLESSMDNALGNSAGIYSTFQVIKTVSGQFWSPQFAQINTFNPGQAYMMYVSGDPTTVSFTDNYTQIFENNPGEVFDLPVTDNNMSVVFPAGTLTEFAGYELNAYVVKYFYDSYMGEFLGEVPIDSVIVPTSTTIVINEDGSAGISVIGTDNMCNCDLASAGDEIEFSILMNGETIILIETPSISYNTNGVEMINTFSSYTIDGNPVVFGCTDEGFIEFDYVANMDNGSCVILVVEGCTDSYACNYNSNANTEDGSCIYFDESCCETCEDVIDVDNDCPCDENELLGCTDSLACNYNELSTDSDASCTYTEEGYDCEGNILQLLEIGALMHGGIVFYIDESGEHGLIAALADITEGSNMGGWGTVEGFEWGCSNQTVIGADGTSIGTGYQNTLDIVAENCQTQQGGITAAQAAFNYSSEGFTDWYLPSYDELLEMYNTIGNGNVDVSIGGFEMSETPYYWFSSELSNSTAWFVYFYNVPTNSTADKIDSLRVRAVRSF